MSGDIPIPPPGIAPGDIAISPPGTPLGDGIAPKTSSKTVIFIGCVCVILVGIGIKLALEGKNDGIR